MGQGFITRRGSGVGDSETAILTKVGSVTLEYGVTSDKRSATLDISKTYSNYSKLSVDDICFPVTTSYAWQENYPNSTMTASLTNFKKSYNPKTGIITISATGSKNYVNTRVVCDVYIIERVPNPTFNGIPYGYVIKFGSISFSNKGDKIPLAVSAKGYQHSTSITGRSSSGNIRITYTGGYKEVVTSETTMSGNQHTTVVDKWIGSTPIWLVNIFPLVNGYPDYEKLKTITGINTGGNIICWLEPVETESLSISTLSLANQNEETEVEVHEL